MLVESKCGKEGESAPTSHQIHYGEQEDPDQVDEVPEQPAHLDAIGEMFGIAKKKFLIPTYLRSKII